MFAKSVRHMPGEMILELLSTISYCWRNIAQFPAHGHACAAGPHLAQIVEFDTQHFLAKLANLMSKEVARQAIASNGDALHSIMDIIQGVSTAHVHILEHGH